MPRPPHPGKDRIDEFIRESFLNSLTLDSRRWKEELEQHVDRELPSILLANKADLEDDRKVGLNAIHQVGKVIGVPSELIFETSALIGTNVDSAFQSLAALIKKPQ